MPIRACLAAVVLAVVANGVHADDRVADAVVKIDVTHRAPDFMRPWTKATPQESGGTGVIIDGKRILTNAHVVLYASQIFVQGNQSTDRVPAKAVAIATGLDLAIVEVEKPSFFEGRPALSLAEGIPSLRQAVSVYGYPIGGEQMSVTQGIISRIECAEIYCFMTGLRLQIDAALNPGNSGGPAVADGKIVGLVHSKFEKGENIGYLIAADEIAGFLKDSQGGAYRGKPQLWDRVQPTENEALRARLGLGAQTGVVVYRPESAADDYPLKKWDVITRIGDHPVDNQGNVKLRADLYVSFQYLVRKLAKEGRLGLTILRDGKALEVNVPVRSEKNLAVPFLSTKSARDCYPRYFVCGPLVFLSASQELAGGMTRASGGWIRMMAMAENPLLARLMDKPAFAGEEIVTLGYGLLPHKTSKGFSPPPFSVVSRVDGTPVRSLAHLVALIRDAKGEFLTIDLAGNSGPLVFRREEVLKATDEILADEGIRRQYSEDLEGVWRPKNP